MRKKESIIQQYTPNQLEIIINPIKIKTYSKQLSEQELTTYKVELEKGPQYISSIKEEITFNSPLYLFTAENNINIQINKTSTSNFHLAVYKNDFDLLQFQDKIPLNLDKIYQNYLKQLRQYNSELINMAIQLQDNGRWYRLKQNLSQHKIEGVYISNNKKYQIWLRINIKIDFDFKAERQKKIIKKLSNESNKSISISSNKSKNRGSINNISINSDKRSDNKQKIEKSAPQKLLQSIQTQLSKIKHNKFNIVQNQQISNIQLASIIKQPQEQSQTKQSSYEKNSMSINIRQIEDRRCQLLSDIVEMSNQGSSLVQNNGGNTDRKGNIMTLIPEEHHQQEQIPRAKTLLQTNAQEHYLNVKRNNSLGQTIRQNTYNKQTAQEEENNITSMENLCDRQNHGKSSLNASTNISQIVEDKPEKTVTKKNYKIGLMLIFTFIVFLMINFKVFGEIRQEINFRHFGKIKKYVKPIIKTIIGESSKKKGKQQNKKNNQTNNKKNNQINNKKDNQKIKQSNNKKIKSKQK